MKKLLLAFGLVAFLMTSCGDKQENNVNKEVGCKDKKEHCEKKHECGHHEMKPGMCPKMMAECDVMIKALANWNDLDEEQRAEAISMAKTHLDKKEAMKAEMEKCCKDGEKKCEKGEKGCCKGEGEGGCKKHEGECKKHEGKKCEGNHEGCKHAEK